MIDEFNYKTSILRVMELAKVAKRLPFVQGIMGSSPGSATLTASLISDLLG